jgi:pyruvate kinase
MKFEPRARKVKILATVGPASRDPDMLEALFKAGADAFRVNMSHGEHAVHAETMAAIRGIEKRLGRPIAILADLQGPKLRVGQFKDGQALICHGARFTLDRSDAPGDETRVQLPHPELFGLMEKGQRLLINDGKIRLLVVRADGDAIECKAEVGGVISDRKGVNVPDAEVPIPALTEKDRRDLAFAMEHGADWIGLSFVQRPEDLAEARRLMGGKGALCAKIEKPSAIRRLAEIVEMADHGRARRPGRRARAAGGSPAAEAHRRPHPRRGQAGDRGDADAREHDRKPCADARRGLRCRQRGL